MLKHKKSLGTGRYDLGSFGSQQAPSCAHKHVRKGNCASVCVCVCIAKSLNTPIWGKKEMSIYHMD